MPKYRFVGNHATEVHSGEKRAMLAPGDYITISDKDIGPSKSLLAEGLLILIDEPKAVDKPAAAAKPDDEGGK